MFRTFPPCLSVLLQPRRPVMRPPRLTWVVKRGWLMWPWALSALLWALAHWHAWRERFSRRHRAELLKMPVMVMPGRLSTLLGCHRRAAM